MKKTVYSIFLILLLAGITHKSFAQIPNPDFENWTNGTPDGWQTSNTTAPGSVIESNNAYTGSHAAELVAVLVPNTTTYSTSILQIAYANGTPKFFLAGTTAYAIHGWYIANIDSNDELDVTTTAWHFPPGAFASGVSGVIKEQTSVYKEFVFNYYPSAPTSSDSVYLLIELANSTSASTHQGTYFIIDDLSFGAADTLNGVKDVTNASIFLEQNSPNPAVSQTNIIYSLESASKVTLTISDLLGRTVKTVVNENQTPGRYKAVVDVTNLPAGNYFYQVNEGKNTVSKMMAVVK